ncbi:MAG: aminotransferase class IV [Gammaproteobacteria bacterium]|nr:aminotransferase class IV [Gammaproteobacteria bacterium]
MSEFVATASVDGHVTLLGDAKIPVLDRGFLYGDSIYEVFRTYRGVPLFFDEHWQRFENSARLISLDLGDVRKALTADIKAAVAASGAAEAGKDVYVRFIVTRGEGPIDLLPRPDLPLRRVVIVKEVPRWNPAHYSHGATIAIVSTRRNPHQALDPNIKGGNYLNNVLGVIEANALGADDCLMLSDDGLVTEASNSNVFFVIDGALVTPSQQAANLRGLTKAAIHAACKTAGLETAETEITAADAMRATECFLSSATREVMPVAALLHGGERREFPPGGGTRTRRVAELYRAAVDDYVAAHVSLSLFDPSAD